ncbi:hypothetical protein R1sor_012973 [Riccia sorocarpa]|uniref:Protein kinase domain-containing protein n=1 Tax=Riccia sorocarpa TaxID=122646 RepID=A0ABD3I585_9MARC
MAFDRLWGWTMLLLALNHVAEAHVSEAEALLKFRDELVDTQRLYNWGNITNDPCGISKSSSDDWIGVTCMDEPFGGQTVWKLDLNGYFLGGTIAEGLGGLKNLTYLDLTANSFSGHIPSSLGDLYLDELHLGGNQLTGTVPQLYNNIYKLTLENNLLSGDINVMKVWDMYLGFLDLRGNDFTGRLPESLWLTPLYFTIFHLDLSHNRLTGHPPADLGTGNTPIFLDLSGNNLDGEIPRGIRPGGGPWPGVEYIDLSGNHLTGTVPSDVFWNRTDGFYLNLSNNLLTGKIDLTGNTDSSVAFLDLSFNQFEGELEIGHALGDNVEILCLQNNRLSGRLNGIFQRKFVNFDRQRRKLTDRSTLDLFSSKTFPSLRVLDLPNNMFSGTIPNSLLQMPSLEELRLQYNSLQGELPNFSYHQFSSSAFRPGNDGLCGPPLQPCHNPGLSTSKIVVIMVISVVVSGGVSLLFGWIWRQKIEAKQRQQDAELVVDFLGEDIAIMMSVEELRRATDDFSEANQIGVGGFGMVYHGTLDDGTEVAIKRSKCDASSQEKHQFLNEVKFLSQVNHRHLVRLLGFYLAQNEAILVFEFVKNGTLDEHLHLHKRPGRSSVSWQKRMEIAIQTASVLNYLHTVANPPIYHLDVKSANILLDERMNAKVTDFGISKLVQGIDATYMGTMGYMDPESVMSSVWTDKTDVYAYGVVLLELITAKPALNVERRTDTSLVKWAVPLIQSGHLEEIVDSTIVETLAANRDSMEVVAKLAIKCVRFQSALRPSMNDMLMDLQCIPNLESVLRASPQSTVRDTTLNAGAKTWYQGRCDILQISYFLLSNLYIRKIFRCSVSKDMITVYCNATNLKPKPKRFNLKPVLTVEYIALEWRCSKEVCV